MNYEVVVENLKCGGCENTITQAIKKIDKDALVEINREDGILFIETSGSREEIVARLNKLGYPEVGQNNLLHKGRSYLSCAIGKYQGKTNDTVVD
jgi:copper chaperone